MSKFSSFLRENPIKKPGIVAVVGNFDPPAAGHETVFNEAARLANANDLPLRIFVDKEGKHILPCEQRMQFLESFFPRYKKYIRQKGIPLQEFSTFLDKHFEKVIFIGAPHKLDPNQLSESFDIYSSGVRDPEHSATEVTSSSEMIQMAKEGLFEDFKSNLPSNIKTRQVKSLFESLRVAFDLPKRPPVIFDRAPTREEFYSGMFETGERVVITNDLSEGTIKKVGANFIVVDVEGQEKRVWPKDIIKL